MLYDSDITYALDTYATPTAGLTPVITTGSWTPEKNRQILVGFTIRHINAGDATKVESLTGNGVTWTLVQARNSTTNNIRTEVWAANGDATPGPLSFTLTNGRLAAIVGMCLTEDTILASTAADNGASVSTPASVSLTAPEAPSLYVSFISTRHTTLSNLVGQSAHKLNVAAGPTGGTIRINSVLKFSNNTSESIGGSFSGGQEWVNVAVALKQTNAPTLVPALWQDQKLPYAANSPWNKTLRQEYPDGWGIHADNDNLIQGIKNDSQNVAGGPNGTGPDFQTLTGSSTQYTLPLYFVNNTYPVATFRAKDTFRRGSDTEMTGSYQAGYDGTPATLDGRGEVFAFHVPEGLMYPAAGTDSQVIIVNTDTGEELNVWECVKTDGTIDSAAPWGKDANGHYLCTNAGIYKSVYTGTAVPFDGTFGGTVPTGRKWGSRGAKVPYWTGLVHPWEIDKGVIEHPIAFAYDFPSSEFVYPATGSDGNGATEANKRPDGSWDTPEGTRLFLRPDIDIETAYTSREAKIIARAIRDYGLIVIDKSGRPKIYFEYSGPNGTAEGKYTADLDAAAQEIQFDHLGVLDWTGTQPKIYGGTPAVAEYPVLILDSNDMVPDANLASTVARTSQVDAVATTLTAKADKTYVDTTFATKTELANAGGGSGTEPTVTAAQLNTAMGA